MVKQFPTRRFPQNLQPCLRANQNLQRFHERQQLHRQRLNVLRILSQKDKVVGQPIRADMLSEDLMPVAEVLAAIVSLDPHSPLSVSSPTHNLSLIIPAAWSRTLFSHLMTLLHQVTPESPRGRA